MQDYLFVLYLFTALLGLAVGSFLNVVIHRAPRGESICFPASHCTACATPIKWYDNIPVISFLLLRGRCRACGEKIPLKYPAVELLNAVAWVISAVTFAEKSPVFAIICAAASSVLIMVAFVDLEHMIILDRFSITLTILGILSVHFDESFSWIDKLIGLGAAAVLFLGIYLLFRAVTGREGMGFGDVKLALAAGLLLGWQRFLIAVLISSITASILLLLLRKIKHGNRESEYPFGPFLAVGIWTALLFGEKIVNLYVEFFFNY